MPSLKTTLPPELKHLESFFKQNKSIDLSSINLSDPDATKALDWKKLTRNKSKVLNQLKAYQRLSALIPADKHSILMALLEAGIHSALQIASIPRTQFISQYSHCFGKEKILIEAFYNKALTVRTRLLLKYMSKTQSKELSL